MSATSAKSQEVRVILRPRGTLILTLAQKFVGHLWIKKKFPPNQRFFVGTCVAVDREAETGQILFHFAYDDGDEEDLYFSHWIKLTHQFVPFRKGGRQSKTKVSTNPLIQSLHDIAEGVTIGSCVEVYFCDDSSLPHSWFVNVLDFRQQ